MSTSQDTRSDLLDLKGFLKPYRFWVGLLLVLGVLTALLEGVGLGLVVPILQGLSADGTLSTGNPVIDTLSQPFAGVSPSRRLQVLMVVLLGVTALKNAAMYGHTCLSSWLQINLMRNLRVQIFDQLLRVGYQYFSDRRAGDVWNDLTTETNRTAQALYVLVQQTITMFFALSCVGLLLAISWQLTLLSVVMLGGLSLLLRGVVRKLHDAGKMISSSYGEHASVGLEALSAMRVIRLFGREDYERKRFDTVVQEANRADLRTVFLSSLMTPLSELFAMGMFAVVFLLAAQVFIQQNAAPLPLLLTFMFILYRLMPRVTQFNSNRAFLANNLPAVHAVVRMLSPADKPFVHSGTQPFENLRKGVRFEGVTFSYGATEKPVLRDVDLEIPAGKTTALVGASGAGKSTLVDLIPRFYDPGKGRITIDGVDLRELDLRSWRAAIGVVSQDTFVFNTSVRENIAYGRFNTTVEEIEKAARRANAYDFISEMPQGFETVIGDRGVRLSGGQRQRLAIARAVLRNPKILILDEATSALDTASERLVQEALEELSANRTVVVVAHRLSTVANADQVIVLENRCVEEMGTHQELIEKKEAYWRYYSMQFSR